jgi:hypothetical protein
MNQKQLGFRLVFVNMLLQATHPYSFQGRIDARPLIETARLMPCGFGV